MLDGDWSSDVCSSDLEELRQLNASLEQTVAARTAQARAAERLAQERADKVEAVQQRLRRITDASPGALYQFRRTAAGEYSFPFMSAGIEELIGIDWRTATQDAARVFATVHGEDLPGLIAAIERSGQSFEPFVYVFRVPRPAGGLRWIQARSRPSRDEDDGITWDGFLADVTESREQAELVELAQQRLQKITDSINGLVFEYVRNIDGSHHAPFVSSGIEQLVGVSRDAVMESVDRYFATVVPEDVPEYEAHLQRSAREGQEVRWAFRIRHARTGEIRWLFSAEIGRASCRERVS
jgi:PAS domain-containing protein